MRSDITDRMKKNAEIGRIAMLSLRSGMDISDKTARLVAMTVENPDVGRNTIEKDNSQEALQAVWILDDAENMAAGFSDLEGRLAKLSGLLQKEGYKITGTDEKDRPFEISRTSEATGAYELYVQFGTGRIKEASFGVLTSDTKGHRCTMQELEEEHKKLTGLIKTVKKLNSLGIRGEEKMIRLAVFASEERAMVRKAKARRLAQEKQRGSI